MLKRHENKIAMLDGVHAYINENENITAANTGLAVVNRDLGSKIEEIRNLENTRLNVFKGKTISKNKSRAEIINLGFDFASKLFDYGKKSGNAELVSQSDFNRSEVDKSRDTELINRLQNISENVESNLEALLSYGITPEKFGEFKEKVQSFISTLESKTTSQAVKISAGKTISVLFREADVIIKTLDKMIESFQLTEVGFYNGYKAVRSIKDLGKRYRQPKEQIPEQTPEQTPEQVSEQ